MKQFWALMAVLFVFTLATEAHAKRLGGGASFGRTHQTAPAPQRKQDSTAQRQQSEQKAAPQAAGAGKKGMMGGLLGGLLAGGLLAALFAGGAFEGITLTDMLIIALLAFVLFKLIRGMRQGPARAPQPAYAGGQPQAPVFGERRESLSQAPQASAASSEAVPFNLPLGFDTPAFLEGAQEHYRVLQAAWNQNDLGKIREYVSPELYAELSAQRAALPAQQHTEILSLYPELVRADQAFGNAEVSIQFSGRCRDTVEGVDEAFTDIWHLERDYSKSDAPWYIVGIASR